MPQWAETFAARILRRLVRTDETDVGTRNQATREAWLEKALQQIPSGARILDAGAGELAQKRFCGHLRYVSQDFTQYDGKGDGRGLQMGTWDQSRIDLVCDICAIPEPDASFDAVMCVEVFEHLPQPVLALREFARLLRPSGQLVLTAPFCSLTHFAPFHYASGYNRYFFERILVESGFEVLEITPNGNYFEYLAQELRRVPEMAKQHSGQTPKPMEQWALRAVTGLLGRCSRADRGSSEVLAFGFHVRARKIP